MDFWNRRREQHARTPEQLAALYVVRQRNRYRQRANIVRSFFRGSGVLVLTISVSIPFLAGVGFDHKDFVIGLLGVVIAFATAARNFFHWDRVWKITRTTEYKLTTQLGLWETDMARIRATGGDDEKQLERTRKLISDSAKIVERESRDYFATITWPDTGAAAETDEPPKGQGLPAT